MPRTYVDANGFVDAWMTAFDTGGNQQTVANLIGCSSANVSIRAKRMRSLGVDLPELCGKKTVKIDVDALNQRLKSRMG